MGVTIATPAPLNIAIFFSSLSAIYAIFLFTNLSCVYVKKRQSDAFSAALKMPVPFTAPAGNLKNDILLIAPHPQKG
jgi:hypothetical protein